eukprot:scaffold74636_cov37-Prasinocladus_malaysianus.AAC.1
MSGGGGPGTRVPSADEGIGGGGEEGNNEGCSRHKNKRDRSSQHTWTYALHSCVTDNNMRSEEKLPAS